MEKQENKLCCRVVLFPHPYIGHTTPMLNLGNALYSKGFSIIIIQTTLNSSNSRTFPNFTFHYIEEAPLSSEAFASLLDPWETIALLNTSFSGPFRDSLFKVSEDDSNEKEPISCLISDPLWDFAGRVADEFNLPRLALRTGGLLAFVVYDALPLLRQKGYFPLQETKFDEPVPELPPLKVKDLPPEAGHNLLVNIVKEMETSQGIICNTFDELEGSYIMRIHQVLSTPIFPLGPIHKGTTNSQVSIWKQDHTSISWLNTQAPKSVLYVSFGSIAEVSRADFLEIAYGLANSKLPFLWVIRDGLIEGSESNEAVPLPEGYIDMVSQRGHIVNWAPQQEVLAHPAIGGFWTHCGWNSIMESISEGVPMLCLPLFADQTINTRHISENWKIGLQLEKGIERGGIERAIRKLIVEEGEAMRIKIKALKEKANLAFEEGGCSYKTLENLTSYLLSFVSLKAT